MDEEFLALTPKRKSILWNYNDDDTATVIAVKSAKLRELGGLYDNQIVDVNMSQEDGIGIHINYSGTIIWENCDGITTASEIADIMLGKFKVPREDILADIEGYLKYCDALDIIDMNWRSVV